MTFKDITQEEDAEFEAFLRGEGDLARALQTLPQPAPPAALDAAILALVETDLAIQPIAALAANDPVIPAADRQQKPNFIARWKIPLGLAASALIAVQLGWMQWHTPSPASSDVLVVAQAPQATTAAPQSPSVSDASQAPVAAEALAENKVRRIAEATAPAKKEMDSSRAEQNVESHAKLKQSLAAGQLSASPSSVKETGKPEKTDELPLMAEAQTGARLPMPGNAAPKKMYAQRARETRSDATTVAPADAASPAASPPPLAIAAAPPPAAAPVPVQAAPSAGTSESDTKAGAVAEPGLASGFRSYADAPTIAAKRSITRNAAAPQAAASNTAMEDARSSGGAVISGEKADKLADTSTAEALSKTVAKPAAPEQNEKARIWINRIDDLLKSGVAHPALEEWAKFRKAYPDYPVSDRITTQIKALEQSKK
jgi:hypothetical protein